MSEHPIDHGPTELRERLTCVRKDPCAYDHTCSNHKILAELERHQAEAAKAIRAFKAQHDSEFRDVLDCESGACACYICLDHAAALQRAREGKS